MTNNLLELWLTVGFTIYCGVSGLTFLVYYYDKKAAQSNRLRISERNLHLLGLLGGWPGALLAQHWFRHKTSKTSFQIVYWLTVTINIFAVLTLIYARFFKGK